MRIGVLTSSRADYGIYKPLLNALANDPFFNISIIAFGTHLADSFGRTIDVIKHDGFTVEYTVDTFMQGDDPASIAAVIGSTITKFSDFWKKNGDKFDSVFCLGDRFEMFASVIAGTPFGIKFAHIHGGETTLGAIDNIYRHSITLASVLHFVSADEFADRVIELTQKKDNVFVCGSLSVDSIRDVSLLSKEAFTGKWQFDIASPYILVTVHPETVDAEVNKKHVIEFEKVLEELLKKYSIVITMPNADTYGGLWRDSFRSLAARSTKVLAVENFGTQSYFTCLKHSSFLLGNTSSGIIEAASFGKYVINIGTRQQGRLAGENIVHVPVVFSEILEAVRKIELLGEYKGINPYYKAGSAQCIINALKHARL